MDALTRILLSFFDHFFFLVTKWKVFIINKIKMIFFFKGNVVKWFFKVSHKKISFFHTILAYSITLFGEKEIFFFEGWRLFILIDLLKNPSNNSNFLF